MTSTTITHRPASHQRASLPGIPGHEQSAHETLPRSKLPFPALLYLLAVVIPIGFDAGPLVMTTLRLFLLVLIIPLVIRLITGKYGRILLTDVLFILHIAWATMALAVNNPDQVIQQIGSVGIEFIGGYLVGRAYIRTREAFAAMCRALTVIVCCLFPFALVETETGRPLIVEYISRIPGISSVPIVTIEGRMGLERVQAVFAHPIHYGLFCSIAFSLAFVALKGAISPARRWVTSILIAGSGFLALSSGALLALLLQFFLIMWASLLSKLEKRWWLLVIIFVVAYIAVDIISTRSPFRVFMSYATFSAHNAYWRSIILEWGVNYNVLVHPTFGIGMNDWVRPWYMHSGSMDNFWLVMAVRYGVPGFFLLAFGYANSVFWIMRRNFEEDETLTQFRRAWVFIVLGLSFTLSTVHIWTNIYSFVFFFFGSGMWIVSAHTTSRGTDEMAAMPASGALRYTRFSPTHYRHISAHYL